jgi:predicted transposase/invertase (TIGR01784 family)
MYYNPVLSFLSSPHASRCHFYQLFKRFPRLFFELITLPPELAQSYRFESVEVKEPTFRIDGVFLPTETAPSKPVFFIEVQFQPDPLLYHRFFAESMLYAYRNPTLYEDWQGVIIFPTRGLEPDNRRMHRSLLQGEQVQIFYLDELPETDELPLSLSLMHLTIASDEELPEQARGVMERARAGDASNLSVSEIMDMVATIATYKFVNLSRAEVEAMMGINLEDTRIYREAKADGVREDIESLLKVRFTELDDELTTIVENLAQLPADDRARMILQLSRDELIAQFRSPDE